MGRHELAEPASGFNPFRSLADVRDFVHRAVTGVMMICGTYQVAFADPNGAFAVTWLPAVFGVVDAALSVSNSVDRTRRTIYALAGLGQLVLVGVGWATDTQAAMIAGFVLAALNSVYASQWTATTPTATLAVAS